MSASISSPDGKNFCQFMTSGFPKPKFLAQIHPGLVGALFFIFPKYDIDIFRRLFGPSGPLRALLLLHLGTLGPLRAHLVLHLGPWGP